VHVQPTEALFDHLPNAEHGSGAYAWIHTHSCDSSPNSGDFVDFISLDNQLSAIVVGDVAGSGSRSSAAARSLQAFVRSSLLLGNRAFEVLEISDQFFARYVRGSDIAFASLFIAILDVGRRTLMYASAGHDTALLYSSPKRHVHLPATGPLIGLGLEAGAGGSFTERAVSISDHSTLIIATDGITDARSPRDPTAFFGSAGIVRAIESARAEDGNPARSIYLAALSHSAGDLRDDASVVVAQPALGSSLASLHVSDICSA
jgi:sigma-B regulation protein RsbU (phosphoserine phosphatase)